MINNIIKLFYSEVVKTKMSNLPHEGYELRNGVKKFRNVTLKIDSVLLKMLKFIVAFFLLYISFRTKFILGVGVLLIEIIYLLYKISYENQVKEIIRNTKDNIEVSTENILNDNSKAGINLLITLLVISVLTKFNIFVGISFVIVFIYTAKNLYEGFKQ